MRLFTVGAFAPPRWFLRVRTGLFGTMYLIPVFVQDIADTRRRVPDTCCYGRA
jgi:hypothetical protein